MHSILVDYKSALKMPILSRLIYTNYERIPWLLSWNWLKLRFHVNEVSCEEQYKFKNITKILQKNTFYLIRRKKSAKWESFLPLTNFFAGYFFYRQLFFFRQIFAEDFFYQRNFMPNFFSSEKVTEIDGSTT